MRHPFADEFEEQRELDRLSRVIVRAEGSLRKHSNRRQGMTYIQGECSHSREEEEEEEEEEEDDERWRSRRKRRRKRRCIAAKRR
jgi:hypothetical protein